MFQQSTEQANELMQTALPLMEKLEVPPTPSNYGLWYEYVSNTNPRLNKVIDRALRRFGNLPDFVSKELFNEFLLPDQFQQAPRHEKTLQTLTETLTTDATHISTELSTFNKNLETAKKALKFTTDSKQLEKLAGFLENSAFKANQAISHFDQTLSDAQAELTALRSELNQLRKSNERDDLTLLLNNKGFEKALYKKLPHAEDDLSVLLIDIDNLGDINREYDIKAGDGLIRFMAKLLLSLLPENAAVARIDGGRFGVLLNETELAEASRLAETIRESISTQKIRYKNTKVLLRSVTASVGVATLLGDETPKALIERAEHYLTYAKRSGKNQIAHHE
ncbi:GGDEF domain-containing protein [Marinomonas algarum]|uniref:diguanylate cyclase n=1 Tax=Marinomonas algarum TaxID=2883105 RepID=A0A9X1IQ72_9GAMM|nr:GGDEF domain-containing protein [Marinomonas algarum]MCB5161918.1 GGDEF domain-containing protein [Marinomonas algarum]